MNTLNDFTLTKLLTPAISSDKNILHLAEALTPNLQDISPSSWETLILARIDSLPENMLDLLAWQFHADFYDLAYNIDVKRRHIKSAILWHLRKGTRYAILEALRLIDIQAQFINWPDFDGQPYTFMISAVVAGPFYRTRGRDKLASSIRRAVNEAKAARSLMVKLDIHINEHESTGLFGTVAKHQTIDISLGVNQKEMHELLLIFEKRILTQLTNNLNATLNQIDAHEDRITSAIAESEDLQATRLNDFEARTRAILEARDQRQWQRIADNYSDLTHKLEGLAAEFRADINELKELLTWTE